MPGTGRRNNVTIKTLATLMVFAACAPTMAVAQEPREHHGYGGGGLVLTSSSDDLFGDSGGGGIILNGAGLFNVSSAVGIGVDGDLIIGNRGFDDDLVGDAPEVQFSVNGGAVFADILYVSLGVQSLAFTPEEFDPEVTFTYTVAALGVGVFKATDNGHLLAQLRFGGGTFADDEDFFDEDVDYVGIRLEGQIGMGGGVQFLGGIHLDTYDFSDFDAKTSDFRVFAGAACGT
jgi:hypothetical protein